jgi:hypothetical protein
MAGRRPALQLTDRTSFARLWSVGLRPTRKHPLAIPRPSPERRGHAPSPIITSADFFAGPLAHHPSESEDHSGTSGATTVFTRDPSFTFSFSFLGFPIALDPPLLRPFRSMPIFVIRSQALFALPSENSHVTDRRPHARATVLVVPEPQNGSSTRSPSFEHARITRSR